MNDFLTSIIASIIAAMLYEGGKQLIIRLICLIKSWLRK